MRKKDDYFYGCFGERHSFEPDPFVVAVENVTTPIIMFGIAYLFFGWTGVFVVLGIMLLFCLLAN